MIRYTIPEFVPFIIGVACFKAAMKNSEEAKKHFVEVVKASRLPDCVKAEEEVRQNLPEPSTFFEELNKRMGLAEYMMFSAKPNPWMPDFSSMVKLRDTLVDWMPALSVYKDWDKQLSADFIEYNNTINRFIRESFNSKINKSKGVYKVTGQHSPIMVGVVRLTTFLIDKQSGVDEIGEVRAITYSDKTYTIEELADFEVADRVRRFFTGQFKLAGWEMFHDEKMEQIAERWYQCRVVCSGPKEYCLNLHKTTNIYLDSGNVSKEIKECDKVMGYPRGSR